MDNETLQPILAGIVRHALTSLGGALVAGGYIQSSQTASFVGGGMVIAGAIWSWWQKDGQKKIIATLAKMKPVASPNATTSEAAKAGLVAAKEEMAKSWIHLGF